MSEAKQPETLEELRQRVAMVWVEVNPNMLQVAANVCRERARSVPWYNKVAEMCEMAAQASCTCGGMGPWYGSPLEKKVTKMENSLRSIYEALLKMRDANKDPALGELIEKTIKDTLHVEFL